MTKRLKKVLILVLSMILVFSNYVPFLGNLVGLANSEQTPVEFPNNFAPYTDENGTPIFDPGGDEHPIDVDITSGVDRGVGYLPSVYVTSDDNNFFVRYRLKGDPYDRKGGFLSTVWLVQIADSNNVHQATIGLNGKSPHEDYVYVANANGTTVNKIYVTSSNGNSVPGTNITSDDNGHYFLDFQVPISEITKVAPEINGDSKVKLFFGSSRAANLSVINKEWMNGEGNSVDFTGLKGITLQNPNLTPNIPVSPPIITIDESVTQYTSNMITITGTTSLNSGTVSFDLNGTAINKTATITTDGKWSLGLSDVISDQNGSYLLTAKVTESGITAKTEKEFTILKENVNRITIQGGAVAIINKLPHILQGDFAGQNPQNYRIRVYKDGSQLTDAADTSSPGSNSWKYELPESSLLENQTVLIEAKWTDSSGKVIHATTSQRLTYIPENSQNQPLSVEISSVLGDAQPEITGTTIGAETIEVQIDGKTIEIIEPNEDGSWKVESLERPLSSGKHTIVAIAKNSAGDIVTDSKFHNVTETSITIDNGLSITINDNKPTIRGNTNAGNGEKVTVSIGEKWTGTTTVSNGRWMVEVPDSTPIPDGTYTVTAQTNNASATQKLTINSSTAVAITSPTNESTIDETVPVIEGTSEINARVDLQIVSNEYAKAIDLVTTNGSWTYTPTEALQPGMYTVTATAYDTLGNEARDTSTFTITSETAPEVPDLTKVSISGQTKYGETLSATQVTFSFPSTGEVGLSYQWKRDSEIIEKAINSTYTLDQEDIGSVISVTVTADGANAKGNATSEATGTIEKADGPVAPAAPEKEAVTSTSITLISKVGQEYSIDGGNEWQDSTIFKGLDPGTDYTFITRIKETDTHKASDNSEATTINTEVMPVLIGVSISGEAKYEETLSATDITYSSPPEENVTLSYQWLRGSEEIEGATQQTYKLAKEDIGSVISVTVTADGVYAKGSATSKTTNAIEKADGPAIPDAPIKESTTSTSITLERQSSQEYSINNGLTWQDNTTFEGLSPDTEYSFITRIKETETHKASGTSEATNVKTKGITDKPSITGSILAGTNQISGTSESGATIIVKRDNVIIGTGIADEKGSWTIEIIDSITLLENDLLSFTAEVPEKEISQAVEVTVVRKLSGEKNILSTQKGTLTEQGNIINIPTGTDVQSFKEGIIISENATFEILTGPNGSPVEHQGNTLIEDSMIIRVKAEDGSNADYTLIVIKQVELSISSNPSAVVGDGESKAVIEAELKDNKGNPIPNIQVQFYTTDGTLSKSIVMTDESGKASVILTSPKIEDTKVITNIAKATVSDPTRGIYAEEEIQIHFAPPVIIGQVIDAQGNPIVHAKVWVEIDGIKYESITDENGNYNLIVPRGGQYTLTIEVTQNIGGQIITTNFTQKVSVEASGQKEEFKPKRKVTGQLFVGSDNKIISTIEEVLPEGAQLVVHVLNDPDNKIIASIDNEGRYELEGFDTGKKYEVVFNVELNGQVLAGKWAEIKVEEDGQIVVQFELIDPFGLITDSNTKELLSGVQLKLYWANTAVNIANNRIPNTLVELPELMGFPPNKNRNPQISTDWLDNTNEIGNYAWMVFANGDYYVIAEKEGYVTYDSRQDKETSKELGDSWIKDGVMHIGKTMMRYDFSMNAILKPNIYIEHPIDHAYLKVNTPTITGTTTAGDGSTVSMIINNQTYVGSISNKSWSVPVTNTLKDGKYTAIVTVVDRGLSAEDTVTFTIDTTKPQLTLNGNKEISIIAGETYNDAGAIALDIIDGDITNRIKVAGIPNDMTVPGSYNITYTVTDNAGNKTEKSRTLIIVPKVPKILEGKIDSKNGTVEVSNLTPGATVTIKDKNGNVINTGIANAEGKMVFSDLEKGIEYTIIQTVNGIDSKGILIRLLTDDEEVNDTLRNLEIGYQKENETWESVTSNVYLLRTDKHETDVLWSSSHPEVVQIPSTDLRQQSITALVNRQEIEKSVTITATVSKGNIKKTRTFLLIIKATGVEKVVDKESDRQLKIGESSLKVERINVIKNNQITGKIDKIIVNESIVDSMIMQSTNGNATIQLLEDPKNVASEFAIEINRNALSKLARTDTISSVTIENNYGKLVLNKDELKEMSENNLDLFIRLVPITEKDEQLMIKKQVESEEITIRSSDGRKVKVLGTPIMIETNYRGFETEVFFPFNSILDQIIDPEMVRVFIEHSDEKVVAQSSIVYGEDGSPIGIKFKVKKFSTFTIFEILDNDQKDIPSLPEEEQDKTIPIKRDEPIQKKSINNKELPLPNTATSIYNLLIIGLVFICIGLIGLYRVNGKKRLEKQ